MNFDELIARHRVDGLIEAEIEHFNRVWHRLDAWPDAASGLARLKQKFILATLSNGNVALLVNMAKRAGLPWDAVLGAETVGAYKPQPARLSLYRRDAGPSARALHDGGRP